MLYKGFSLNPCKLLFFFFSGKTLFGEFRMFDLIRFQCSVLKEIDRSLILFGREKSFRMLVSMSFFC